MCLPHEILSFQVCLFTLLWFSEEVFSCFSYSLFNTSICWTVFKENSNTGKVSSLLPLVLTWPLVCCVLTWEANKVLHIIGHALEQDFTSYLLPVELQVGGSTDFLELLFLNMAWFQEVCHEKTRGKILYLCQFCFCLQISSTELYNKPKYTWEMLSA